MTANDIASEKTERKNNNHPAHKLIIVKEDWLSLILIFFMVLIFLHTGLFPLNSSQVLSSKSTDTSTYFFPTLSYASKTLSKGKVPLWNPYSYSGIPFMAIIQTAIFYPLNYLYLILPLSNAINWTIFIHLFLSGVFTYYLLKNYGISCSGSTAGGIIYTFSAPHIMHIYAGHLVLLATIIWTPLMFLLLDRFINKGKYKYGLFLSLTIALQLWAGYPQHLFYSMIALSFYLLFLLIRLRIKGTAWVIVGQKTLMYISIIILGLFLSAVQFLPTMELTMYSTRKSLTFEHVSLFSFPPENLITFLIPDFFGDMLKVPYWGKNYLWEMTVYTGILPLLLSLISLCCIKRKIVYFFSGLAIFSLVLALGKYTPMLKLLYTYVPGFNLFRGNSKFVFLNAFSLAVLSGFGVDALVKGCKGLKGRYFRIGIITLNLIAAITVILMILTYNGAWFKEAITEHIQSADFYNNSKDIMKAGFETSAVKIFQRSAFRFMMLLISGSILLLLHSYEKLGTKSFVVILFTFIILDLFSFGMRYMVTFDSKEVYWDREVVTHLKKDKEPFRVIAPGMGANTGIASSIETPNGYDAMLIKRYNEFINFSQGINIERPSLWLNITKINKLTDMLNTRYLVIPSSIMVNNPSFKLTFKNHRYSIYRNQNALPRALIVYEERIIKDRNAIFKEMASSEFDPAKYAIIEEELANGNLSSSGLSDQTQKIKFSHYSPDKIIMDVENPQRGLLLIGNVYYPGWKAYIDAQETKIYSANYIMQAIELPAGRHTVMFHYRPLSFKIGAIISISAIIFIITAPVIHRLFYKRMLCLKHCV